MMLLAVLSSLLITFLFALTASRVERVLLKIGRPCRGLWLSAAVASVGLSTSMLFGARQLQTYLPVWITERMAGGSWYATGMSEPLKEFLTIISAGFALLSIVELVLASLVAAKWKHEWLDGTQVRISENFGPAVFGFLRPQVVMPRWLWGADPETRAAALAHEQEHIAAHDRLLSLLVFALLVVMPWNPFLHWQVRRLRLAIEVDCDARVVYRRHTLDATAYAEALQRLRRGGNSEKAIVAMAEQNSSVQLRIRLLLTRQR
jgi:hypothetical protein